MALKKMSKTLMWYPFKEGSSVLEADISALPPKEDKFDYIIFDDLVYKNGLLNSIELLKNNLKENGRFIVALDNKFALRFFAGNPENILGQKFQSFTGYNGAPEKIYTYTKNEIRKILQKSGFNYRFYYPLPDYRKPNVIFTDEQPPEYATVDKYDPYYCKNSDILFSEVNVLREILKTDKEAFSFFANSFIVEICPLEVDKTFNYISFNNLRRKEYQLITKISNDYVEKQCVSEAAEKHLENIKENIKILENTGLKTPDYIENGKIKSRYIEQKYLFDNVLIEKLKSEDRQSFFDLIDKYFEIITKDSYRENDYQKTVFAKYGVESDNLQIIDGLHFLENGLWDLVFKNCFFKDGEFLVFDQEWNERALPAEFILYRSIIYTKSLHKFVSADKLFEKYRLGKYVDLFKKLDEELQKNIRDEEIWAYYSRVPYFDIDATKQEMINLGIRSHNQALENENLKSTVELLQNQLDFKTSENERLTAELNKTAKYIFKRILRKFGLRRTK